MRNRLPVELENLELPIDKYSNNNNSNNKSYGYVSVLYLLSLLITIGSVLTVLFLGNR